MSKSFLKGCVEEIEIFRFLKARLFLKELFACAKRQNPSYTHVDFSSDLELGSANAHSIMSGSRKLGPKAAEKVARSLRLSAKQSKYLLLLVEYERATKAEDSEKAFEALMKLKATTLPNQLSKDQLDFFAHWSHAVILELLRLDGASDEPEWLVEHLQFRVGLPQIKKALRLLKDLRYIEYSEEKQRLFPTNESISTGDQVAGFALQGYHQQMIELAKQSIRSVHFKRREISAITVAVPSSLREEFQKEIVKLRKSFLERADLSKDANEIVQVNFQLFPVAEIAEADND